MQMADKFGSRFFFIISGISLIMLSKVIFLNRISKQKMCGVPFAFVYLNLRLFTNFEQVLARHSE